MVLPIVFGVLLLLVSAGLFYWWFNHGRVDESGEETTTQKYLVEQSRRRFHVNSLVALCGIAFILVPFLNLVGASIVGLLTVVIVIRMLHLAMVDMASTQKFIVHSQIEQMQEAKVLQDEIERFQEETEAAERNGESES